MTTFAPEFTGVQTPRVYYSAKFTESDYKGAVALGQAIGIHLDPWQQLLLKHIFAEENGTAALNTIGISVPRQNGKNAVLEIFELYAMVVYGHRILHTAHEVPSVTAHFERIVLLFEHPALRTYQPVIRSSHGEQQIKINNGGVLKFRSRSGPGVARGFSVDWLVIDEAQEYTDKHQAALRPIISASPNAVVLLTGTPPTAATQGEVFKRIRTSCLEQSLPRRAWLEWSAESDADLDDVKAWAQANPALGVRITLNTVEDERTDYDEATFAQERLGMWTSVKSGEIIDQRIWQARTDPHSAVAFGYPEVLAIDTNPAETMASLSVAGQRADGKWHVEKLASYGGIDWLPEKIIKAFNNPSNEIAAVVIDEHSAAKKFIPTLQDEGIPLIITNKGMMATACEAFYQAVMNDELRHRGQPELAVSLSLARKRKIPGGAVDWWGWQASTSSMDLTPLVSCTLALFGARQDYLTPQTKKKHGPARRVRI